MVSWRKLLLTFIVLFVIVDLFLFFFLFSNKTKTNINFISLNSGYSWEISKNNKNSFENKLIEAGATNEKIVVVMSPKFEVTPRGAGWGDGKPVYYGKWNNIGNYEILTVYTDENELQKLIPENRTKLLNLFVTHEIVSKEEVLKSVDATDQL